jgi:hypothetical protein
LPAHTEENAEGTAEDQESERPEEKHGRDCEHAEHCGKDEPAFHLSQHGFSSNVSHGSSTRYVATRVPSVKRITRYVKKPYASTKPNEEGFVSEQQ